LTITGSVVLSYIVCKREAWFMAHGILPDQENPFLELGRFIHENSYKNKGEKEIELPGMKIDLIWESGKVHMIGEIKKSSRYLEGAKFQLLYYLMRLKEIGVEAHGEILIPKEKRRIKVEFNQEFENRLKKLMEEINETISLPVPPPFEEVKNKYCPKCGYRNLCFA